MDAQQPKLNTAYTTWKILIIEDDEDDYLITRERLKEARGWKFDVSWAATYAAGQEALDSTSFDAVLVDYSLGLHTGIQLIREATERGYPCPFILVTGHGSYEVDMEAMQAGATLYLTKDEANSPLIERAIRYAIELKQKELSLRASEAHLRASEAHLRKSNEALSASDERFYKAFSASPNALAISRMDDGNIQAINEGFEHLFGYNRAEAVGKTTLELNLFAQPADREEAVQRLRAGQSLRDFELDIRTKAGEIRQASISSEIISQSNEVLIVTVIQDITERKLAEEEQREHLLKMELQRRLLDFREQERQIIAREIHDGPVQDLSSLLFTIQFARAAITDPAVLVELEQISLGLRGTVQNLREMISEMRPPSLIRFGLARALEVYLEEFKEKHPEVELESKLREDGERLSEQARLSLFRIVQEALNNITRHTTAKRIKVRFEYIDHGVVLEICDNGKGFAVADNLVDYSVQGHFGLVGMKERAEAIGGVLEIRSKPKRGTTIRVVAPAE
jgi:two-component system sensor histidine kinase UhpB